MGPGLRQNPRGLREAKGPTDPGLDAFYGVFWENLLVWPQVLLPFSAVCYIFCPRHRVLLPVVEDAWYPPNSRLAPGKNDKSIRRPD